MDGKAKCRMLKEIRRQIAEQNDIALVTSECTHQGKCRGTCPKCEAEVAYLERELEKRRSARKRVALAGISAGMAFGLSSCTLLEDAVDAVRLLTATPTPEVEVLDGEIEVMGDVYYEPEPTPDQIDIELTGIVDQTMNMDEITGAMPNVIPLEMEDDA